VVVLAVDCLSARCDDASRLPQSLADKIRAVRMSSKQRKLSEKKSQDNVSTLAKKIVSEMEKKSEEKQGDKRKPKS
jgi:hypothetical protein